MELQKLKQELDKAQIQQKSSKIKLQQNRKIIQSLKLKVINRFDKDEVGLDQELDGLLEGSDQSSDSYPSREESPDRWDFQEKSSDSDSQKPKNSIRKINIENIKVVMQPSEERIEEQIKQIEEMLLADLETTELFKMKGRIAEYITEYVQLERARVSSKMKKLQQKVQTQRKKLVDSKMQRNDFKANLTLSMQITKEWEAKYN